MLTKTDLSQIQKVVRKEVKGEVKKGIKEDVKTVVQKELKPIKTDVAKIRKDIDVIISLFDREYLNLRQRVERIEDHLGLPPLSS